MPQAPEQLADAWTRLYRAKENYDALVGETVKFLYEYVKGMVKGWDPEKENFVLQLRDAQASILTGRPRALVVDIVEDLRAALDYMVFELSALNAPDLNEQVPQFVISDTKEDFDQKSNRRLRYLTEEQKTEFIEKLQPFNGNLMLGILRDISGQSKHRRLLTVRDDSDWEIHMAAANRRGEYERLVHVSDGTGPGIFCTAQILRNHPVRKIRCNENTESDDRTRRGHCSVITLFLRGRPVQDRDCAS